MKQKYVKGDFKTVIHQYNFNLKKYQVAYEKKDILEL